MARKQNNKSSDKQQEMTSIQLPGDVLAYMQAEEASNKDIYLLNASMDATLRALENLQRESNSYLKQIQADTRQNANTLSSMDTSLKSMLRRIDRFISDADLRDSGTGTGAGIGTGVSADFDKLFNDLGEKIVTALGTSSGDYTPTSKRKLFKELGSEADYEALSKDVKSLANSAALSSIGADKIGSSLQKWASPEQLSDSMSTLLRGFSRTAGTGNSAAADTTRAAGDVVSDMTGDILGDVIGGALSAELPVIGPIIGEVAGQMIGNVLESTFNAFADYFEYLTTQEKNNRDKVIEAGFDKIKKDVTAMATYSIDIYSQATSKLYESWDKNLGQITATQSYTKEALNSLQDAVAQRLIAEGYGGTIDASEYLDSLANTLNAKLGGDLAEAFAAQNLILQKAVPEVDLSSMASDFAAIYARAEQQGYSGEETMINAMNQIAGATKALEQTTHGNNQFINQTGSLLKKAEEVINRAGGDATQIVDLATQMMAAEAPLAALAPELSGFTSELVDILTKNNDASAVALRSIMHDINQNVGISATDFMTSFVEDTQGTLSTAFAAIQSFIDRNENTAARQEFLEAMQSVFGISGDKLAQLDFGTLAEEIARASTSANIAALTDAENLVRRGQTTSLEEQLVANTANNLLAVNAISTTVDNKLMRKLEQNELELERLVYTTQATQTVNFAEETLSFFTKIFDIITSLTDPFGMLDGIYTKLDSVTSAAVDMNRYVNTALASAIGSTVTDSTAGLAYMVSNTIGGASAAIQYAETKNTAIMAGAVTAAGSAPSYQMLFNNLAGKFEIAADKIADTSQIGQEQTVGALREQIKQTSEYQEQAAEADSKEEEYEKQRAQAVEQQRAQAEEERLITSENHDNIEKIRESISTLDDLSNYLAPILQESQTHNAHLEDIRNQITEVMHLVSTLIEARMVSSPEFAASISYDERLRIMDNGYVSRPNNSSMVPAY